jgi:mRNA-degrading endonuclease YafQ of YafQ-DinJ toxin-antitoxin module
MSSQKIRIEYSVHFISERKKFVKNNIRRFNEYDRIVSLLVSNPVHPSLNLEKLQNTKGTWTIRLNKSDRIFFIWKNKDTVIFVAIGKHDKYRKY